MYVHVCIFYDNSGTPGVILNTRMTYTYDLLF